jgi:ankyrin repeat protein
MLIPHDSNLIEEKDKYGDTPLILAACYGNKAVVEYLLAHNAHVDGKNQDDYTPLIFASQNGHKDIVEILLRAGADVNARGNEGTSPLIIASQVSLHFR